MMTQQRAALCERVEGLACADREVDAEIAVAVLGYFVVQQRYEGEHPRYAYRDSDGNLVLPGQAGDMLVREFTGSIDAALTLVPEGQVWNLQTDYGLPGRARVWDGVRNYEADGDTPAIALCAAALKARASIQEQAR